MNERLPLLATSLAALLLLCPPTATAQDQGDIGVRRVGLRAGVTIDPDQIHVGAHVNAGTLAEHVRLQPAFDIGFGDSLTVGTINVDALYLFRPRPWTPYVGGGLGIALIDFDDGLRRRGDGLEVEAGLNLIGGVEWGPTHKYFVELRAGVGDLPDLKLTAGINF